MKYIKLFETYKTIDEIRNWLDKYDIKNYTINDNLTVDVDGNVFLNNRKISYLSAQFRDVSGDFYCHNNQLTSLEGCPSSVGGYFYCHNNQLTSLEGCPSSVGGDFSCYNNQLTSLEGAPSSVGGYFSCSNNKLTSLEGCPSSVGGGFYCSDNQLTSLEGAPVDCMSRGELYNIYDEGYKFSWNQKELDEYWEEQIEKEPLIFKYLKPNGMRVALRSNQISQELYDKYKYINRVDKSGLWNLKRENSEFNLKDEIRYYIEKDIDPSWVFGTEPDITKELILLAYDVNDKVIDDFIEKSFNRIYYEQQSKEVKKVFNEVYDEMSKDAKEKILEEIEKNSNLYSEMKNIIDNYIDVPQHLKRSSKTGLWDLKNEGYDYEVGDTVICINNSAAEKFLSLNKEYKIKDIQYAAYGDKLLFLDNFEDEKNGFFGWRFKPLEHIERSNKTGLWDFKEFESRYNKELTDEILSKVKKWYNEWLEDINIELKRYPNLYRGEMTHYGLPLELYDEFFIAYKFYEYSEKRLTGNITYDNKFKDLFKKDILKRIRNKFEENGDIYVKTKAALDKRPKFNDRGSFDCIINVTIRNIFFLLKRAISDKNLPSYIKRSTKSGLWGV